MELSEIYIQSKGMRIRKDSSGVFLIFDPFKGAVHELSSTAKEIFGLVNGRHTVSNIIEKLKVEYDAPEDIIRRDVIEVLQRFIEICIIIPLKLKPKN